MIDCRLNHNFKKPGNRLKSEKKTSMILTRREKRTPLILTVRGPSANRPECHERARSIDSVREDVRWTYAVHEPILPALRRVNVPVRWTEVTVRRTPATPTRRCGNASFSSIARSSRPSWPSGRTTRSCSSTRAIAVERRDWPTALGHLQRSLRGSAPTDSIVRKLFALIARCHQMLGNLPAALNACSEGLRIDPDDAELHFRKAVENGTACRHLYLQGGFSFTINRADR